MELERHRIVARELNVTLINANLLGTEEPGGEEGEM